MAGEEPARDAIRSIQEIVWDEYVDEQSGHKYEINRRTGESRWKHEQELQVPQHQQPISESVEPARPLLVVVQPWCMIWML